MFCTPEGSQNPFPHGSKGWEGGQAFFLRESVIREISRDREEENKDIECKRELVKSHSEIMKQPQ